MSSPIRTNVKNTDEVRQSLQTIERNRITFPKTNSTGSAPGLTDDLTQGYSVHSLWADTSTGIGWVCTDATEGKAQWFDLTGLASTAFKTATGDTLAPASTVASSLDSEQLDIEGGTGIATVANNTGTKVTINAAFSTKTASACYVGSTAPSTPVVGQFWIDTS